MPMIDLGTRKDFAGRTVLVCGAGVAGASAARALVSLGATVLVTDAGPSSVSGNVPAGAEFAGALGALPESVEVIVTSPGLRPDHPLLLQAGEHGLPILGELEFAWRIRGDAPADWLVVTGTNGKTTTVRMLEAILLAAGRRALAVGNVGVPVIDAVMADQRYDVLAVEASSFQLHHSATIRPRAGVLLNLAPDHLDWHGTAASYAEQKAKVWAGGIAIGNADDPRVAALLRGIEHPRKEWFTLGEPGPSRWGRHASALAVMEPLTGIHLILPCADVRPSGLHNQANALAAAASAHAVGVPLADIARGLRAFVPDRHRNEYVATVGGVDYVDDSKATNPHAAAASLAAYRRVVWIAGGQLKGVQVEELVAEFAPRLRAAVLLGADRELIAAALARHAPDLPVITVSRTDDGAMLDVVTAAASLARAGDVVLLAPAAASYDMFTGYAARGAAFGAAVADLNDGDRR